MNNFVIDTPDNFWQIRWLDKYMEGHKGFIAGGCFKNILSGERVKDIDIFFESESDFQEAIDSFNDEKIRDMLNKASADIMKWCDKNMIKYNKELKESRSTKKHCEGLRKHIANLERRLLKHALANVILSIISVAAIIALFTLIQN